MQTTLLNKATLARAMGYTPSYFFAYKVHANLPLMAQLEDVGYNRRTKTLSPREVELICKTYGYPIDDEQICKKD